MIRERFLSAAALLQRLLGVDGSGSGLDADLLDGVQGADLQLRSEKDAANGYVGVDSDGGVSLVTGKSVNLYNTADQTTNYERLRLDWSSNVARISSTQGGTGPARDLQLGAFIAGGSSLLTLKRYGAPFFHHIGSSTGVVGNIAQFSSTSAAASGIVNAVAILPTYNQSGTAGGTDLLINRTQTSLGSGTHSLIDAQVGGVSQFRVGNAGDATFSGSLAAAGSSSPSFYVSNLGLVLGGTSVYGSSRLTVRPLATDTNNAIAVKLPSTGGPSTFLHCVDGADVLKFQVSSVGSVTIGGTFSQSAPSSVGQVRLRKDITTSWIDSTDATRKARVTHNVYDTAARPYLQADATGSGVNVSLLGLPTYADNAAAVAGGLATNTVYKTSTGELRIVV